MPRFIELSERRVQPTVSITSVSKRRHNDVTIFIDLGFVPPSGVGAVGKWPAGTTAESLARAGHLPTAAADLPPGSALAVM